MYDLCHGTAVVVYYLFDSINTAGALINELVGTRQSDERRIDWTAEGKRI
jgi:hypothetical protein